MSGEFVPVTGAVAHEIYPSGFDTNQTHGGDSRSPCCITLDSIGCREVHAVSCSEDSALGHDAVRSHSHDEVLNTIA